MIGLNLPDDKTHRAAIALLLGLLALRLAIVVASPLELYADEAQYWRWGQTLDWGYYSKPPMIAWVIHGSTTLFGDSEAAIRIFAPILHTVAAVCLYLLSRQMFGAKASLITLAAYLLMPGIILSSTIISTDGVLFPFWCLSLYLFWQLREHRLGWAGAAMLGAAIGIGFLSKYAMLYFGIGIALTSLIDAPTRRAVLSPKGALIAGLAALILSPHLAWNAANSFQTVGHTVDNANLGGELFNLENLPKFLGDQMGVFGPVSFLALIAGLVFMRRTSDPQIASRERWLSCFIVPVLIIIGFQAVLSRAHANWAATAYPAASILIGSVFVRAQTNQKLWFIVAGLTVLALQIVPELTAPIRLMVGLCIGAALLVTGYFAKWRPIGLFWAGIGLHLTLAGFFAALMLGPQSWISAAGMDNSFKRTRGWQALTDQLVIEAERIQPSAILVDEREIWHGIDYYGRDRLPAPLILWRRNEGAKSFAEQTPLTNELDHTVLVASYRSNLRPRIKADFATWQSVGAINVELGHRGNGCPLNRTLQLYLVSDFAPLDRTQDWVDRFKVDSADGQRVDSHIDRPPRCPVPSVEQSPR